MARLVGYSTHRLQLGMTPHGPEWLELRDRLSWYERQRLNSAMLDIDVKDGEAVIRADPGRYQPAILAAYVCGWQLYLDDGTSVPFSPEAMERLDEETATLALAHIDEITTTAAKKEESPPTEIEAEAMPLMTLIPATRKSR